MEWKRKKPERYSTFNHLVKWQFGSLQVLIWVWKNLIRKSYLYTLYIRIHRVQFGRLEGYENWAKFLALDYLFVGFRLGQFLVYICDLDRCYWVWVFYFIFKPIRNITSIVGLGLDPLLFKLSNSHLVGWLSLDRHRVHVAYYVFFSLQFNALATFIFDYACSFLLIKEAVD